MGNQVLFANQVKDAGAKAGLAIDLATPVSALSQEALLLVDVVIVLSVQAGFGGQNFDEGSLAKIEELNEIRDKTGATFTICDDGGITLDTIALTSAHGVDSVAVGKRIFHGNLEENIDHFKKAAMR
jgi:ribulose-phosphate 3-epimerase